MKILPRSNKIKSPTLSSQCPEVIQIRSCNFICKKQVEKHHCSYWRGQTQVTDVQVTAHITTAPLPGKSHAQNRWKESREPRNATPGSLCQHQEQTAAAGTCSKCWPSVVGQIPHRDGVPHGNIWNSQWGLHSEKHNQQAQESGRKAATVSVQIQGFWSLQ